MAGAVVLHRCNNKPIHINSITGLLHLACCLLTHRKIHNPRGNVIRKTVTDCSAKLESYTGFTHFFSLTYNAGRQRGEHVVCITLYVCIRNMHAGDEVERSWVWRVVDE